MTKLNLKVLKLQDPYNVTKIDNLSYSFTTSHAIEYNVIFFEDYTLDEISNTKYSNTFQFVIEKVSNETEPYDRKVGYTICGILQDFFQSIDNCLLFVCDNHDEKSRARKNHFDMWYQKFSGNTVVAKMDVDIVGEDNNYTYASLLIREDHPQFISIKNDFLNIPTHLDK